MNRRGSAEAPTLLVLRALGLGDFLTAVPAYRALARAFPAHRRVLAAPRALHPLTRLLEDTFAAAIDAQPLEALPEKTPGRPAIAVNLHGSGPQSHRLLLATAPQRLIAFAHADVPESGGGPRWDAREHEVARWCRLLVANGIDADPRALELAAPAVDVAPGRRRATLVHAGAASEARRWPAQRWAEVTRICHERGERVLLTGSMAERPLALGIAARAGLPPASVIAGETTLLELAAIVAQASRLVCGDTGIAHLASAYEIPSVVLFGPTAPQAWGPPPRLRHRVIWAGRTGDPHARVADRGLLEISVARVIVEIDELQKFRVEAG